MVQIHNFPWSIFSDLSLTMQETQARAFYYFSYCIQSECRISSPTKVQHDPGYQYLLRWRWFFVGIRIRSSERIRPISRQSDNEPSDIMLSVHDIDVVAQSQNAIPRSILETKCDGDNFEMLVTILAVFVTNVLDFLIQTSGTNIQRMSQTSKKYH